MVYVPQPSTSSSTSMPAVVVTRAAAFTPRRSRPSISLAPRAMGGMSYKDAGVDIDAGNELVRRIQKLNPSIGGFSGMVPFGEKRESIDGRLERLIDGNSLSRSTLLFRFECRWELQIEAAL